ncbi:MAG: hypothetical protein COV67_14975 [Nitrospinae bacterium CG11_big_fil_rev_8_21_14_0_20_56_8]|nr:MAG: hypothetical protein COV67_14975 [Nitrospinae bacterium CG11_big_fil_rev_8_21_14_0_20_56_8]
MSLLTRADKILIGLLVLINFALFSRWDAGTTAGAWVVIESSGKEIHRYSLGENRTVSVPGPLGITEVQIENRRARIIHSPCKNKVCIKSGYLEHADRLAACIPNRVVVRIVGNRGRDVDAVVG